MTQIQQWIQTPMVLYPLIIWSIVWKGLALWRAARLRQVGWYIALLVINTVGVFEIIYLIATNKRYKENNPGLR
jgi:methionyl-tRNA synthetase